MQAILRLALVSFFAVSLGACSSSDPGPLAGIWQFSGPMPMKVQFRKGESEALGMIEKVSYEINGNQVVVTTESGPMKGVAARYTLTGPNTAVVAGVGTLTRIK